MGAADSVGALEPASATQASQRERLPSKTKTTWVDIDQTVMTVSVRPKAGDQSSLRPAPEHTHGQQLPRGAPGRAGWLDRTSRLAAHWWALRIACPRTMASPGVDAAAAFGALEPALRAWFTARRTKHPAEMGPPLWRIIQISPLKGLSLSQEQARSLFADQPDLYQMVGHMVVPLWLPDTPELQQKRRFFCSTCSVQCPSQSNYERHCMGRRHAARTANARQREAGGGGGGSGGRPEWQFCDMCNIRCGHEGGRGGPRPVGRHQQATTPWLRKTPRTPGTDSLACAPACAPTMPGIRATCAPRGHDALAPAGKHPWHRLVGHLRHVLGPSCLCRCPNAASFAMHTNSLRHRERLVKKMVHGLQVGGCGLGDPCMIKAARPSHGPCIPT